MSEGRAGTHTLAEREAEATGAFNDLRSDAKDMKEQLDAIGSDVSQIEVTVARLDEDVFDLTVQRSGAMDLMKGPLVDDTDNAGEIGEIVEAEAGALRGDLGDVHDSLSDAQLDLVDLNVDLISGLARVESLAIEIDAIRAEGGEIHPDSGVDDVDTNTDAWMDNQLNEPPPGVETETE
jgi:hypothetical protein